jgi:hypothetical protein
MRANQIKRLFLAIFAVLMCPVFVLTGCAGQKGGKEAETAGSDIMRGEVLVSFDYVKQSGIASNQFAVWIEDMDGNHVKTLYAARYTAKGGYAERPDSIPIWVEKFDPADRSKSQVDAITGATPQSGRLSYTWDLTDEEGNPVAEGSEFRYFVEASLRWKNHVLYAGTITVGNGPIKTEAEPEYVFEASNGQEALTESSSECKMLGSVTAEYIPAQGE